MKGVVFVDKIVFSYSGNHFSHAVLLGDVDRDGWERRHTKHGMFTRAHYMLW